MEYGKPVCTLTPENTFVAGFRFFSVGRSNSRCLTGFPVGTQKIATESPIQSTNITG